MPPDPHGLFSGEVKHADGTYEYAGYERFESGRASKTFSVKRFSVGS